MGTGLHAGHGGLFVGLVADDEDANARKLCVQFADDADAALLQERDTQQDHMRLEPADAFFEGFLGAHELMGFDFIVQHELQRGARDLVFVHHEHAPLVDGLCGFDTDLHVTLAEVF